MHSVIDVSIHRLAQHCKYNSTRLLFPPLVPLYEHGTLRPTSRPSRSLFWRSAPAPSTVLAVPLGWETLPLSLRCPSRWDLTGSVLLRLLLHLRGWCAHLLFCLFRHTGARLRDQNLSVARARVRTHSDKLSATSSSTRQENLHLCLMRENQCSIREEFAESQSFCESDARES